MVSLGKAEFRFALSEWLHLGVLDRDIQSSPRRKLGRLPACYFVCERNSVGRIRTQVGVRFERMIRKPRFRDHAIDLRLASHDDYFLIVLCFHNFDLVK
jgi:hypothetical protein